MYFYLGRQLGKDFLHRRLGGIVIGIIANPDFIGKSFLGDKTSQLLGDVFFTMIGGYDNGNSHEVADPTI